MVCNLGMKTFDVGMDFEVRAANPLLSFFVPHSLSSPGHLLVACASCAKDQRLRWSCRQDEVLCNLCNQPCSDEGSTLWFAQCRWRFDGARPVLRSPAACQSGSK